MDEEMSSNQQEWYSYSQVLFRRKHILWVLENADSFQAGRWPTEPGNGYYDAGGKRALMAEGRQVKPAIIVAEITERLEQCETDGAAVLAYYMYGVPAKTLSKLIKMKEDELVFLMNRAIGYAASGACRRWMPCDNCLNKPRCEKQANHKPVSYKEFVAHRRKKDGYKLES